jgi:prefoldin subunit 1
VNKRLTRESSEASAEIASLEKKLQYHETTNQKSRENLQQILGSGGRAWIEKHDQWTDAMCP